jgi:hypothetical protein
VSLHPAENRGYRELFVTARQARKRLDRLGAAFAGTDTQEVLEKAAQSLGLLLDELAPPLAFRGLHTEVAAQGGGEALGTVRVGVFGRFLERNQALRLAVDDLEHIATLLGYLAAVSEARGDAELPELCRGWERRLRRQVGAVRKAALALGGDLDAAVEPVDPSPAGRAAHRVAWAIGAAGEWTDRQIAQRRRR